MKINNKDYTLVFRETITEIAMTTPRLASVLKQKSVKARLYVEDSAGHYFVVEQYQSNNFGQPTPA